MRLKLLLADVVVLAVVLTVLPMLWAGDAVLRAWEAVKRA